MIPFILANWRWLAPAGIAVILGLLLGVARVEVASLKEAAAKTALAVEQQKTEANKLLADETAKVLARERANTELNATLEKERADAQAQHVADNANLRDAMATWMRAHPGCRTNGGSAPSQDPGAGKPEATPALSTELLPVGSGKFIQRCSAAADELAAYARECHAFVTTLEK